MSIPDRYKDLAETLRPDASAWFTELEKSTGTSLTDEAKNNLWENGLWRLFAMRAGESLPVPESITPELITITPAAELAQLLWDYLCVFLDEAGCYQARGKYRETIIGLPRGLRVVYTLSLLSSEVYNGGFEQFFANPSGEFAHEALADLQFVGAEKQAAITQQAIAINETLEAKYPFLRDRFSGHDAAIQSQATAELWSDIEKNVAPEFDRLDREFYKVEDSGSMWNAFDDYARQHPEAFFHSRVVRAD